MYLEFLCDRKHSTKGEGSSRVKMIAGEAVSSSSSEFVYSDLFLCVCLCRRVVILMELEVLKSADEVGVKIGNPVPYNEGKRLFASCSTQSWDAAFRVRVICEAPESSGNLAIPEFSSPDCFLQY